MQVRSFSQDLEVCRKCIGHVNEQNREESGRCFVMCISYWSPDSALYSTGPSNPDSPISVEALWIVYCDFVSLLFPIWSLISTKQYSPFQHDRSFWNGTSGCSLPFHLKLCTPSCVSYLRSLTSMTQCSSWINPMKKNTTPQTNEPRCYANNFNFEIAYNAAHKVKSRNEWLAG